MSVEQSSRQSDQDAFSIKEFCERHGISQSFFFKLRNRGLGPRTMRLGTRVLITREDARQWRKRHAASARNEQTGCGDRAPASRRHV